MDLTPTEKLLTQELHRRRFQPNNVVTHDELMSILSRGPTEDRGILYQHITSIKKKFKQIDPRFDCMTGIPNKGYFWNEKGDHQ